MRNVLKDAMMFATWKHVNQTRKYIGTPYIEHCAEVAALTHAYIPDCEVAVVVAWLHDVVEDCDVTLDEIETLFGYTVRYGVEYLSDVEEGNRAERKRLTRIRLSISPDWVQTIKCADIISNTKSIVQHDKKFAATYIREIRELLPCLKHADADILERVWKTTEASHLEILNDKTV